MSIDIRAGGQKRMEADRLHDTEIIQDRQHKLNLERDKKSLCLSKIAIIISLVSLLFAGLTYFQIIPQRASTSISAPAPTPTPPTKIHQSVSDEATESAK